MVKDYDVDIQYHPGKANLEAADTCRKAAPDAAIIRREVGVQRKFKGANIVVATEKVMAQLARLTVQPTLRQRMVTSQREDPKLQKVLSQLAESLVNGFSKTSDEGLLYQGRLYVSTIEELRKEILTKLTTRHLPCTQEVLRCTKI